MSIVLASLIGGGYAMRTIAKLVVGLGTLALVMGHGERTVQAKSTMTAVQAQTPMSVTGELLSVDVDDMSFIVKLPDKPEVTFLYTERTVVSGAEKGAAGLLTMKGKPITVSFTVEGTAKIATKIEVGPAAHQG
jgi:hypothetical protein